MSKPKQRFEHLTVAENLVEYGPAIIEPEMIKYSYVEFANHGRLRNVGFRIHLKSKFEAALAGAGYEFHFVKSTHLTTFEDVHLLIAIGEKNGIMYSSDFNKEQEAQYLSGQNLMKWGGWALSVSAVFLILIGIPLIFAIIGVLMIPLGITVLVLSRKMIKIAQYGIDYLEFQNAVKRQIPNLRSV